MRVRLGGGDSGDSAAARRISCDSAASSSSQSLHHPFDGMRRRGTNGSSMTPAIVLLVLASYVAVGNCRRWTIDDLRSLRFPYSHGVGLGMAVCKAPGFMQDVALMDDDIRQLNNVNRSFHKLLAEERAMRVNAHTLDSREAADENDKRRAVRKLASARKKLRLMDGRRGRRAATARTERIWPHGIIPYEIQANFSGEHKALFKKAMRHWENYTCISFVERTPQDENYIVFTVADCGCCSFVGKRGDGPQAISIGKNCDKFGIVVHELGHVVGFWHEHTRPDRDQYVDIFYKSIQQGQDYNFEKLKSDDVNSLGESYDYASIMHYARDTFARAMYMDTILPKSPKENRPEIGQRIRLSDGDIRQANKLYQCPMCGRTLMNPSGVLSIDQDDRADDQKAPFHCEWRIIASKGERIQLNITDVSLPSPEGGQCASEMDNFIIIRDGHFSGSPIIAKLCGSNAHQRMFSSTGNRLFVELRSSRRRIEPTSNGADLVEPLKRGLARPPISLFAAYRAMCGGELTGDSGIIESPHYPENYPPDGRCTWTITVQEGFQVAIKFDLFSLEQHKECIYDRLEVYELHESGDSHLLGRLCGQTIPENVKTLSSNKMQLDFYSDNSVQKSGFSLQFIQEFDECKTETHGCEHKCVNLLGGYKCECDIGYELNPDGKTCEDTCGGYIRSDNGTIYSPNFPQLYPSGKRCVWEIDANPGYQITLNFTHLNIEGMKTACEYDYIKVMSVGDGDAESDNLGKFCGDYLEAFVVTSTTNRLRVEFVSDNSVEKTGFAAYFLTDLDECKKNKGGCQHRCINLIGSYKCECDSGFVLAEDRHNCKEGGCNFQLKDPEGKIFSPNYPHDYPKGKTCAWHFVTTPGHRLSLNFDEFVLEEHTTCRYDKVQMFDGGSDVAPTMGNYCGSQLPPPITSTSNELYLVFHTDASVARRGFAATYSSVCGGVLEADESVGFIYSHARYSDHKYQKKMKCEWTILARPGMGVQLRFTQFNLEQENACEYDYVEILDGESSDSSRFGRYCGEKLPPTVVSTGTALTLELHTDDSVEQKGFVAEYRLSEQGTVPPYTVPPPPTPRPSREPIVNNHN